jgi:hypothetical protein
VSIHLTLYFFYFQGSIYKYEEEQLSAIVEDDYHGDIVAVDSIAATNQYIAVSYTQYFVFFVCFFVILSIIILFPFSLRKRFSEIF